MYPLQDNAPETLENGGPHKKKLSTGRYKMLAKNIKEYSFWLFACIFIGFLICFSIWILTASDYYTWEPSPKYNTVEVEEDSNTTATRLFSKEETTFKPTSRKKTVESTFRFKDIFKNIIFPKVQSLQGLGEESEEASYEEEETTTVAGEVGDGQ